MDEANDRDARLRALRLRSLRPRRRREDRGEAPHLLRATADRVRAARGHRRADRRVEPPDPAGEGEDASESRSNSTRSSREVAGARQDAIAARIDADAWTREQQAEESQRQILEPISEARRRERAAPDRSRLADYLGLSASTVLDWSQRGDRLVQARPCRPLPFLGGGVTWRRRSGAARRFLTWRAYSGSACSLRQPHPLMSLRCARPLGLRRNRSVRGPMRGEASCLAFNAAHRQEERRLACRWVDENGARRSRSGFPTKTAAREWLDDQVKEVAALRRGEPPPVSHGRRPWRR